MKIDSATTSNGLPSHLSDDAFRRIANRSRTAESDPDPKSDPEPNPHEDGEIKLEASSFEDASREIIQSGFRSVGSAIYKKGQRLWSMLPSADGRYTLVRLAAEPSDFPIEDDPHEVVQDAPFPVPPSGKQARVASVRPVRLSYEETLVAPVGSPGKDLVGIRDRYGISVRIGDVVSYPLGGDFLTGKVAAATTAGYLDIQLEHQMDTGVPSDFVTINRQARVAQELPEQRQDNQDKENLNLTMHKSLEAKKVAFTNHWVTYGATLADQVLHAANLPKGTIGKIGSTLSASEGVDEVAKKLGHKKIVAWESLSAYAGRGAISSIRSLVMQGVRSRMASKNLNLPLAIAYEL